jgi:hypothetical protein
MTTQPSQPVLWYTVRQGVKSGPFDDAEIERQVDAGYLKSEDGPSLKAVWRSRQS